MSCEPNTFVVDRFVRRSYTQDVKAQRILDYLRALRDGRFTQDEVGAAIGYSGKQIGRWERASSDAPLAAVIAYLEHVNGSWDDVRDLMMVPETDPLAVAQVRRQMIQAESIELPYNPLAGLNDAVVIALADQWNEDSKAEFREEVLSHGRRIARLITGRRREPPSGERRAPRP